MTGKKKKGRKEKTRIKIILMNLEKARNEQIVAQGLWQIVSDIASAGHWELEMSLAEGQDRPT